MVKINWTHIHSGARYTGDRAYARIRVLVIAVLPCTELVVDGARRQDGCRHGLYYSVRAGSDRALRKAGCAELGSRASARRGIRRLDTDRRQRVYGAIDMLHTVQADAVYRDPA